MLSNPGLQNSLYLKYLLFLNLEFQFHNSPADFDKINDDNAFCKFLLSQHCKAKSLNLYWVERKIIQYFSNLH